MSKLKKVLFIVFLIIVTVDILIFGFSFGENQSKKLDQNRTQEQVEKYIVKYLKKNYSINCNLEFKNKELKEFCTFNLDRCCNYKSIYEYEYTCIDEDGKQYKVNYVHEDLDHEADVKIELEK